MKNSLILFLAFFVVVNIADARRGSKKAGEVEKGVYTDAIYGFSLSFPDAWDVSVKKDDQDIRVVLTKKEYEVPMAFQHAPNYTTVPKITVIADTSTMSLPVFVDSLLSDNYKTDQKKNILSETKILFGDFQERSRTRQSIGGYEGIILGGRQQYTIQVQRQGSESDKADVVTDYYGGAVAFVRNTDNNTLLVINFICEDRYFSHLEKEFMGIVNTLKFGGEKE